MTTGGSFLGTARLRLSTEGSSLRQGLNQAEQDTKQSVERMARSAAQLGAVLAAAGAAATAPIVAGVTQFARFEQSMANVQAVSGATSQEFEALTGVAREMGETTVFTANQSAQALSFMSMAGLEAAESVNALPDVLNLAAAGNLALADSADIVTNIMAGYGIASDNVTAATDVLVTGFTSANTNLQQLGEAFTYAGPVAKAAGVQFEESAAALSLMGNAGFQASLAGTSLRGAVVRLLNPSAQAEEILDRLGVTALDSSGKLLPLRDIITQFEDVGLSAADAMEIFGLRAGPAMLALIEQGSDALIELTREMENSGGTAQRIADTQLDTFQGSVTLLKSATEGLLITLGEGLAPTLRSLADYVTEVVQAITTWANENPALFQALTAVLGVVGALSLALGVLLVPVGLLYPGIELATRAIIRMTVAMRASRIAASGMLGPIGLIITLLGVAVTTFLSMRDAADDGAESLEKLREKMSETDQELLDMREAGIELSGVLEDRLNKALEDAGKKAEESGKQIDEMTEAIRRNTVEGVKNAIAAKEAEIEEKRRELSRRTSLVTRQRLRDELEALQVELSNLTKQELTAAQARETYNKASRDVVRLTREYNDALAANNYAEARFKLEELVIAEQKGAVAAGALGQEFDRNALLADSLATSTTRATEATERQTEAVEDQVDHLENLTAQNRLAASKQMWEEIDEAQEEYRRNYEAGLNRLEREQREAQEAQEALTQSIRDYQQAQEDAAQAERERLETLGLTQPDLLVAAAAWDTLTDAQKADYMMDDDSGMTAIEKLAADLKSRRDLWAEELAEKREADEKLAEQQKASLEAIDQIQEDFRTAELEAQRQYNEALEDLALRRAQRLEDIETRRLRARNEAVTDYNRKLWDIEQERLRSIEEAEQNYNDSRSELMAKFRSDQEAADRKYQNDVSALHRDYYRDRAGAERNYQERLAAIRRNAQEDVEAAAEDHRHNLASIQRDAQAEAEQSALRHQHRLQDIETRRERGREDLMRQLAEEFFGGSLDIDVAALEAELSGPDARTDLVQAYQEGLAELERESQRAQEDALLEHNRRLAGIETDRQDSVEEAQRDYNQRLQEIEEAKQLDEEEARRRHNSRMAELARAHQARLEEARIKFEEQERQRELREQQQLTALRTAFEEELASIEEKARLDEEQAEIDHNRALADIDARAKTAELDADQAHKRELADLDAQFARGQEERWDSMMSSLAAITEGWAGKMSARLNQALESAQAAMRAAQSAAAGAERAAGAARRAASRAGNMTPGLSNARYGNVTMMASGGLVKQPTLAMLGEAGEEVVIPLDRLGELGGQPIHLHLENSTFYGFDDFADKVNEALDFGNRVGRQDVFRR